MSPLRLSACLLLSLLCASTAMANCVELNVVSWTPDQRTFFRASASAAAGEPVDASWVVIDDVAQVGVLVKLCAPTADISGLDSATLQADAQARYVAQAALDAAVATEQAEVATELNTSLFCIAATLQQIEDRLAAEKAIIMADVNAIDATGTIADTKLAFTTATNRTYGALQALLRCIRAVYKDLQPVP